METVSVTGLFIYPLKSAGGISLKNMDVVRSGPQWDRNWMLVEADGSFITQRTSPSLCKIQPRLTNEALEVSAPGLSTLSVPLAFAEHGAEMTLTIHNESAQGSLISKECDQWFSEYLSRPVHLVKPLASRPRKAPAKYDPQEPHIGFADAFPFLLTSEESLQVLNQKLDEPVTMDRFRPNIVVSGGAPYEEDQWLDFQIGGVHFAGVKDCSRCVIVTVDQQTGLKNPKVMATLTNYRKKEKKIVFGKNLSHRKKGSISLGDHLKISPGAEP